MMGSLGGSRYMVGNVTEENHVSFYRMDDKVHSNLLELACLACVGAANCCNNI